MRRAFHPRVDGRRWPALLGWACGRGPAGSRCVDRSVNPGDGRHRDHWLSAEQWPAGVCCSWLREAWALAVPGITPGAWLCILHFAFGLRTSARLRSERPVGGRTGQMQELVRRLDSASQMPAVARSRPFLGVVFNLINKPVPRRLPGQLLPPCAWARPRQMHAAACRWWDQGMCALCQLQIRRSGSCTRGHAREYLAALQRDDGPSIPTPRSSALALCLEGLPGKEPHYHRRNSSQVKAALRKLQKAVQQNAS